MSSGSVTISADNGIELTVLLGESSPILLDGNTIYNTVARPRRTSVTRLDGYLPWRQDIEVIFDAWIDGNSVEGDINKLQLMQAHDVEIILSGHALKKNLKWLIQTVDWDKQSTIWQKLGSQPVRVRQFATIHFIEKVDDSVIKTPTSPTAGGAKDKHKKRKKKKVKTPSGMTIKQIAVVEFNDADRWRDVVRDNPFLPEDPRYVVPSGMVLTFLLVPGNTPGFVVP